jgi:hypothetical protein
MRSLPDRFCKGASKASTFYLILSSLVFSSGCLTMNNSKAISEYKSSINEFDRSLAGGKTYRIITGRLLAGAERNLLQFDGLLLGEGRYLNVESNARGIRFFESQTRLGGMSKKAFLIQQNACCMDDKAFRSILFLKGGDKADLSEILKQYDQFETGPSDFPTALLVMDFSNIYSFSAMHPYWEKGNEVSYFVQAPGTNYNEVMRDIEWHERSRIRLAGMYAWYAVAVPVDIVTSPFQLAGILLLGSGMPK